jgi:hypothetical protein
VRLVVRARSIDALFEGQTGKSHDAPTTRTTCTQRYSFVRVQGPWSIYVQVGTSRYAGDGYVQNAPCSLLSDGAARLQVLPSGRLRVDFGEHFGAFDWPPAGVRGYLARAR